MGAGMATGAKVGHGQDYGRGMATGAKAGMGGYKPSSVGRTDYSDSTYAVASAQAPTP